MSGVETSSPIGPQSQLQKMAATTTDRGDRPVLWPYNCGSTTCDGQQFDARRTGPASSNIIDQPGSIAAAISAGAAGGHEHADIRHEAQYRR